MEPIDVTDVRAHADVNVRVDVKTELQVPVQYSRDARIQVDWIGITYRYDVVREWWFATDVRAGGHKILKPGKDGSTRLGKDKGRASWGGWKMDVQEEGGLPEEIDRLVDELRPSGSVTLPGT